VVFDYLILAPGMQASYFGHDEFARHAPSLKTLADAELVRAKVLRAFELAEETEDSTARRRLLTFVLVGAGPTGVELAASIAGRARHPALELPADRSSRESATRRGAVAMVVSD
jgi:NADH dehydrogenase